jgi:large subunit ribosomal protein L31
MKKDIHPDYRYVVFKDVSADYSILTRSTIKTSETTTWTDGKEYPLYKVDISSASHPFYTGNQKVMDTEGRVERFMKKYSKSAPATKK